ncbi:phage portal protein [Streptomyces fructofermentans]|uniref:Uncharacterized protein n=1 Tax=Streptomyces fructofermentans TaxID=152141 RepID=A0A918NPB1_9ACTN|nr:phage portal protein [Streptomyces fructofermentans]GGX84307.1 hypothetical protein GCM10010515_59860 [Streptomyces fructofermentans]
MATPAGRADGWDLGRVVTEGYERVVWVYKAIDTMGKHAARLPLEIGRGLTDDGEFEEVIEDHPLLRLLNGKKANPLESDAQFRKQLSAQTLLSKRGKFCEVTRSNRGTITRLDLLPPDRVLPIPDQRGEYIKHREFTTLYGHIRELDPERVIWVREPHPTDPFSGQTPLEAAGISIELDHLSRLDNVAFITNDSRPGGIVAVDTADQPGLRGRSAREWTPDSLVQDLVRGNPLIRTRSAPYRRSPRPPYPLPLSLLGRLPFAFSLRLPGACTGRPCQSMLSSSDRLAPYESACWITSDNWRLDSAEGSSLCHGQSEYQPWPASVRGGREAAGSKGSAGASGRRTSSTSIPQATTAAMPLPASTGTPNVSRTGHWGARSPSLSIRSG